MSNSTKFLVVLLGLIFAIILIGMEDIRGNEDSVNAGIKFLIIFVGVIFSIVYINPIRYLTGAIIGIASISLVVAIIYILWICLGEILPLFFQQDSTVQIFNFGLCVAVFCIICDAEILLFILAPFFVPKKAVPMDRSIGTTSTPQNDDDEDEDVNPLFKEWRGKLYPRKRPR